MLVGELLSVAMRGGHKGVLGTILLLYVIMVD